MKKFINIMYLNLKRLYNNELSLLYYLAKLAPLSLMAVKVLG